MSSKTTEIINKFEQKKSRDEIFQKAKRKDGKLTPDGCAYLWRNCRASAAKNGFQAEMLKKEKGMLSNAYERIGELYPAAVWNVMERWVAFTKYAETQAGAFNMPLTPNIGFFVKFIEQAATFNIAKKEDFGVKLVARDTKPLTNTNKKPQNTSNAASIEEAQAIAEKYNL